jgi:hypothetical protein
VTRFLLPPVSPGEIWLFEYLLRGFSCSHPLVYEPTLCKPIHLWQIPNAHSTQLLASGPTTTEIPVQRALSAAIRLNLIVACTAVILSHAIDRRASICGRKLSLDIGERVAIDVRQVVPHAVVLARPVELELIDGTARLARDFD